MHKQREIPLMRPFVSQRSKELVQTVLDDRWIGCGKWVLEFEQLVAKRLSAARFFSTSSCTTALQICYEMSGIGPGDEVITTPLTCLATHVPLIRLGARLVWADIKPNGTIDPDDIARKMTERTKAIVVVDYAGSPCDMEEIRKAASQGRCPVVEDAAQAFGTTYLGRAIGADSDFACFSFQATKVVTTGDGGGFTMRDMHRHDEASRMRWFGIDRNDRIAGDRDINIPGIRAEMNNIGAAIGIGNLDALDERLMHRRRLKDLYCRALAEVGGIELLDLDGQGESNGWAFSLWADDRDGLSRKLNSLGIEAGQLHHRTDKVALLATASASAALPILDRWEESALCLPIGEWVTMEDAEYIASTIASGW